MTRKLRKVALGSSLVVGSAVTLAAATFGILMIRAVTGPTCVYPKFLVEQHRVQTVADATQAFLVFRDACPSGTSELAGEGFLDPHDVLSAYGTEPILINCRFTAAGAIVQVRSAGADSTFHTADDLVVDSEPAGRP